MDSSADIELVRRVLAALASDCNYVADVVASIGPVSFRAEILRRDVSYRIVASLPEEACADPLSRVALCISSAGVGVLGYVVRPDTAIVFHGPVSVPVAQIHGAWFPEDRLFGHPKKVEEFAGACRAGKCPQPELHCTYARVLRAIQSGDWAEVEAHWGSSMAMAMPMVLDGLALGAPVPLASHHVAAFGPYMRDAISVARRTPRGVVRKAANQWLRFTANARREAAADVLVQRANISGERKELWTDSKAQLPRHRSALIEQVDAIHGTIPWRAAKTYKETLAALPPTEWEPKDRDRYIRAFRHHLWTLRNAVRSNMALLWSESLVRELWALSRGLQRNGPARAAVRNLVRDIRSMRAEVWRIVSSHLPADTQRRRVALAGALLERGYSSHFDEVLQKFPDIAVMAELASAMDDAVGAGE